MKTRAPDGILFKISRPGFAGIGATSEAGVGAPLVAFEGTSDDTGTVVGEMPQMQQPAHPSPPEGVGREMRMRGLAGTGAGIRAPGNGAVSKGLTLQECQFADISRLQLINRYGDLSQVGLKLRPTCRR